MTVKPSCQELGTRCPSVELTRLRRSESEMLLLKYCYNDGKGGQVIVRFIWRTHTSWLMIKESDAEES